MSQQSFSLKLPPLPLSCGGHSPSKLLPLLLLLHLAQCPQFIRRGRKGAEQREGVKSWREREEKVQVIQEKSCEYEVWNIKSKIIQVFGKSIFFSGLSVIFEAMWLRRYGGVFSNRGVGGSNPAPLCLWARHFNRTVSYEGEWVLVLVGGAVGSHFLPSVRQFAQEQLWLHTQLTMASVFVSWCK